MEGLPVTIRLLDPPLHEFLPKTEPEIQELVKSINIDVKLIHKRIGALKELNLISSSYKFNTLFSDCLASFASLGVLVCVHTCSFLVLSVQKCHSR